MLKMRVFLLTALLCFVSACSFTQIRPSSLNQIKPESTGIIFPVLLSTDEPLIEKSGCEFRIKNETSGNSFKFMITADKNVTYVEVPEGQYRISGIYCSPQMRWLMTANWPEFHVYSGKISLFGPHDLVTQKQGTPSRFKTQHKRPSLTVIATIFEGLAPNLRDHVVSAYLGTPVPSDMIGSDFKNDHVVVSGDPEKKLLDWKPAFQPCYTAEHMKNELFAGIFTINATYENGSVTSLQVGKTANTFTEQFRKCVISAAKAYKSRKSESRNKVEASYYF